MAHFDNVEIVRALEPGEVSKMTNPQLKRALSTLLSAENAEQPSNNILLDEIRGLRKQVEELRSVRQEVNRLSDRLDEAFKVITQQQLFLEAMDSKERRRNMLIFGLVEEADETGATDVDKVRKVVTATGYTGAFDPESWEIKRLGKPPAADEGNKKRPMLVVVEDGRIRNEILKVAKNLKDSEGPLSRVYVKKDLHPAVRKEMGRIKKREKDEKEKPENAGATITYDWKNRVLLRDGIVIDRYSPYFV